VNWCRIASKNFDLGFTKIRDILRPGNTQAGTRDTGPERDVPANTDRLATLSGSSVESRMDSVELYVFISSDEKLVSNC